MRQFVRFPRTPHLAWLGTGCPRDDKVLSPIEAIELLAGKVVVEEKVDGANLGISVDSAGSIQVQNRNQYINQPYTGQFARLGAWLAPREDILTKKLGNKLVLFGEWCTARHSINYTELPDWLLAFDIYDRGHLKFWSTIRRDELVDELGLCSVPAILTGLTNLEQLKVLVVQDHSRFRRGPLEGIVIRRECGEWLDVRAKFVHPDFTQSITEHWSRRSLEWNHLKSRSPNQSEVDS